MKNYKVLKSRIKGAEQKFCALRDSKRQEVEEAINGYYEDMDNNIHDIVKDVSVDDIDEFEELLSKDDDIDGKMFVLIQLALIDNYGGQNKEMMKAMAMLELLRNVRSEF